MKKLLLSISIFSVAGLGFSQLPCTNLFFSEYIEGSANNKAFEVYNPTSGSIDLSNYHIIKYFDGSSAPNDTLWMTGMLAPGQTYNVVNPAADSMNLEIYADTISTITFFNGDDALALYNGNVLIDMIGDTLGDPGTNGWPVDSGATKENTLVRKVGIQSGSTNWAVGATQWDVYAQNDFSHFNSHTMTACTVGIEDETVWEMSIYPNPSSGIFILTSEISDYSLQVLDMTGKLIINKNHLIESAQIDLSNLPNGIYLIKVNNGTNQITKKVILKK